MRRQEALPLTAMVIVVAGGAAATVYIGGDSGRAATWQASVAPLALIAPLVVWLWRTHRAAAARRVTSPGTLDAAATLLASQVALRWQRQARERRITSATSPVMVAWVPAGLSLTVPGALSTVPPGGGPPPLPVIPESAGGPRGAADDPSPAVLDAGVVTELHDKVYRRLLHGRLVLLGPAGAGKTAAMILLLLTALDSRRRYEQSVPAARSELVPVPVWLSLGDWDPTDTSLVEWASAALERDHPDLRAAEFGPGVARQLVQNARVALFLDGLDEMSPRLRNTALRRLDTEVPAVRVVLTSRPAEWADARGTRTLAHAAVLQLLPVDAATAAAFLTADQTDPQQLRAWQDVAEHLERFPDGVLARGLDSPLTLSLARDTYQDSSPRELLTGSFPDEATLREHLLDRVLPQAYPDEHEQAEAAYWLAWIAARMGSSRDLSWWTVSRWAHPVKILVLQAALVLLCAPLLVVLLVQVVSFEFPRPSWSWALPWLPVVLAVAWLALSRRKYRPALLRPHKPRRAELARAVPAFLLGAVGGWPLGLVIADRVVPSGGYRSTSVAWWSLAGGIMLAFGAAAALLAVWRLPAVTDRVETPGSLYDDDRRAARTGAGILGGVAFLTWVIAAVIQGTRAWGGELLGALQLSGYLAVVYWLTAASSRLRLAQRTFPRDGHERLRLVSLLEDAQQRQVMRQAGAVWQFRHAQLQDRLAARHGLRIGDAGRSSGSYG